MIAKLAEVGYTVKIGRLVVAVFHQDDQIVAGRIGPRKNEVGYNFEAVVGQFLERNMETLLEAAQIAE